MQFRKQYVCKLFRHICLQVFHKHKYTTDNFLLQTIQFHSLYLQKKFVLFEHALGYALLRVKTSSVDTMVELANSLLNDQDEFCRNFKLHCFVPFTSSAGALENCNAISEGVVPDDLKDFLMDNLSTDKSAVLYVGERKLADALKAPQTGLPENITCSTESALSEVYRAIRLHFPVYIKELSHFSESTAQVGLGHSYSRAKVKFNVHR